MDELDKLVQDAFDGISAVQSLERLVRKRYPEVHPDLLEGLRDSANTLETWVVMCEGGPDIPPKKSDKEIQKELAERDVEVWRTFVESSDSVNEIINDQIENMDMSNDCLSTPDCNHEVRFVDCGESNGEQLFQINVDGKAIGVHDTDKNWVVFGEPAKEFVRADILDYIARNPEMEDSLHMARPYIAGLIGE